MPRSSPAAARVWAGSGEATVSTQAVPNSETGPALRTARASGLGDRVGGRRRGPNGGGGGGWGAQGDVALHVAAEREIVVVRRGGGERQHRGGGGVGRDPRGHQVREHAEGHDQRLARTAGAQGGEVGGPGARVEGGRARVDLRTGGGRAQGGPRRPEVAGQPAHGGHDPLAGGVLAGALERALDERLGG